MEYSQRAPIQWNKLIIASAVPAILIFIIEVFFNRAFTVPLLGTDLWKTQPEITPYYMTVLFLTYIVLYLGFNYMAIRLYPRLTTSQMLKYGAWGGALMLVQPSMQFYVALKGYPSDVAIVQFFKSIPLSMIQAVLFAVLYKKLTGVQNPVDHHVPVQWGKFWTVSVVAVILVFIIDTWFHPAVAFPWMNPNSWRMDPKEFVGMYPVILMISYITMLCTMTYIQLQLYPQLTAKSAFWFGLWSGFMIIMPNVQFYVARRYFSHELIVVQIIEGISLMILQYTIFALWYGRWAKRSVV